MMSLTCLPECYQIMLKPWYTLQENINIDVDKDNVFHIPLFFNPKIESKGNILHFKEFISAGIIKIKDIAFECRKGFLKEKYIVEMISEVFPDFSEI